MWPRYRDQSSPSVSTCVLQSILIHVYYIQFFSRTYYIIFSSVLVIVLSWSCSIFMLMIQLKIFCPCILIVKDDEPLGFHIACQPGSYLLLLIWSGNCVQHEWCYNMHIVWWWYQTMAFALKNGFLTCCQPLEVCPLVQAHVYIFFATGRYNPFFIKRSELQVSYERTLITQIINH
jgi:hypothetical protein